MGIKKFIISFLLVFTVFMFAFPAKAANEASFSFSTDQTTFSDGADIIVKINVDAGPYSSTLNTIDFTVTISDTTVLAPSNTTTPYSAGLIFTKYGVNEYANGQVHVVAYIDPDNKPTTRSGVVGTIAFKALQSGSATLSFSDISAAEEDSELGFISTVSSTLTLDVNTGQATSATSSPTVKGETVGSTKTGPEDVVLIAFLGAIALFSFYKYSRRGRYI